MIAYRIEALAPHQSQMVDHLRNEASDCVALTVRLLPRGLPGRLKLMGLAAWDALFRRRAVLYFSSFPSALYTVFACLTRHPRWVYHSQDWIQHNAGWLPRLERLAVRHASAVIWNEGHRAEAIRQIASRSTEPLVVPTYLPRRYQVPDRSVALRRDLARRTGADPERLVAIFAGGGYSASRLSPQAVTALQDLDRDTILVFTGPSRLPEVLQDPRLLDLGLLPYDEMLSVMAACDVGLLLYDHAGSFGHRYQQPGRLTEYLRCGLRLVSTPFPDAEALVATDFCLVVEGYDETALAEAFRTMASRSRAEVPQPAAIRAHALRHMVYETAANQALRHLLRDLKLA